MAFTFLVSPTNGISTQTQTNLHGTSPSDIPRVEGSVEPLIEPTVKKDHVEAIQDILAEMADMR